MARSVLQSIPGRVAVFLAAASLLVVAGCRGRATTLDSVADGCSGHDGPIVVVTVDAMPGDLWTAQEWRRIAPALTSLVGDRASWSGTAIAASSASFPAAVSLWTGLPVRRHGLRGKAALSPQEEPAAEGQARSANAESVERLAEGVTTLAEALAGCGYETTVEWNGTSTTGVQGLFQGVSEKLRAGPGHRRLLDRLATLGERERRLVWIHVDRAEPPWLAPRRFRDRLESGPPPLEVRWGDLENLSGEPLRRRERIARSYRLSVAAADHRVGVVLERLRKSPAWPGTVLAVAGTAAADVDSAEPAGYSSGLSRRELTVPVLLSVPERTSSLLPGVEGEPAAAGLFDTLVGLVGGEGPPSVARGWESSAAERFVESELALGPGESRISWLLGEERLLASWTSPTGTSPTGTSPTGMSPGGISGPGDDPREGRVLRDATLERWSPEGTTQPIDDAARRDALLRRLDEQLELESAGPRAAADPCRAPPWTWTVDTVARCPQR